MVPLKIWRNSEGYGDMINIQKVCLKFPGHVPHKTGIFTQGESTWFHGFHRALVLGVLYRLLFFFFFFLSTLVMQKSTCMSWVAQWNSILAFLKSFSLISEIKYTIPLFHIPFYFYDILPSTSFILQLHVRWHLHSNLNK